MHHNGNPNQPGTQQWYFRQEQDRLRHSRQHRLAEQGQRDLVRSHRRLEEQRRRDQSYAQPTPRAGGRGFPAGLSILRIIVAVVALVIILSNITSWGPQLIAVLGRISG